MSHVSFHNAADYLYSGMCLQSIITPSTPKPWIRVRQCVVQHFKTNSRAVKQTWCHFQSDIYSVNTRRVIISVWPT